MKVLLDTNIVARAAEPAHPFHSIANEAIRRLHARGDELVIVPQVLYEFWAVATRPLHQNGLGFTWLAAQLELAKIESLFAVLDDTAQGLATWKRLVIELHVMG